MRRLKLLLAGESGQATTEYALVICMLALMTLGFQVLFLRGLTKLMDGVFFTLCLPYP